MGQRDSNFTNLINKLKYTRLHKYVLRLHRWCRRMLETQIVRNTNILYVGHPKLSPTIIVGWVLSPLTQIITIILSPTKHCNQHRCSPFTNISVCAYSISYNYKSSQGTLDITCSLRKLFRDSIALLKRPLVDRENINFTENLKLWT